MLSSNGTTNPNNTPTNRRGSGTPSSVGYTTIPTDTFDHLIRNQKNDFIRAEKNDLSKTEKNDPEPSFSTTTVISLIVFVATIVGTYYNFKADVKEVSVKIDALEKELKNADTEISKRDIIDIRSEIKSLNKDLSNYNFKAFNANIIKIDTDISTIKSEVSKNSEKILLNSNDLIKINAQIKR